MPATERREREKQELRQKILRAASEIIKEEGYDALTIRKIATRLDYSPMALYSHFVDKQAILLALAGEVYKKIEDERLRRSKNPLTMLRRALLLYIDFGLRHASEYQLVFMTRFPEPSSALEEEYTKSDKAGYQSFGRLTGYVAACVSDNKMKGDPFEIATVLWAGVHGVVSLLITQTGFPFGQRTAYATRVVDTLLRGVISDNKKL